MSFSTTYSSDTITEGLVDAIAALPDGPGKDEARALVPLFESIAAQLNVEGERFSVSINGHVGTTDGVRTTANIGMSVSAITRPDPTPE